MSRLFTLVILLSAAVFVLSTPTGSADDVEDISDVKNIEMKKYVDDNSSFAIVSEEKNIDSKIKNTSSKNVKDDLIDSDDKKNEAKNKVEPGSGLKEANEIAKPETKKDGSALEMSEKKVENINVVPPSDVKEEMAEDNTETKSDTSVAKNPKEKMETVDVVSAEMNNAMKLAEEVVKKTDELVMDIKDSIKNSDDPLKVVDSKLRDVASAVAEVVTNLPLPGKPERPEGNKYSQVFSHFISDLMQVPMVIVNAISTAIASLTGRQPQPTP